MEFSHSDNLPNSRYNEIITSAQDTARKIKNADRSTTAKFLEDLNIQAVGHGLTGCDVELHTNFAIKSTQTLNLKTGEFHTHYLPDDTPDPTIEGTLLGFRAISHSEGNILMYHIQTDYVPDHQTFYVADVPVEDTRVMFDELEIETAADEYRSEEINYFVQVLSQIRDEPFRKNLTRFLSRIEGTAADVADADYFADIGLVSNEMLAHEKVMRNDEYKEAIVEIISHHVLGGAMYSIQGHSMSRPRIEGASTFDVKVVEVKSEIARVELVDNYTISSQQKLILPPKGQFQPAFVVYVGTDIPRYIPLRQLNSLKIIESNVKYDESCEAAFARQRNA